MLSFARTVGDALLAPFAWLPPLWGLLALSVVLGAVLLVAFRWLSPQRRLRLVKDRMLATVYEMRLFADSPRLVLAALVRSLRWLGEYLLLATPALLILAPIVGLLLARAATLYEYRPLSLGDSALVSVTLTEGEGREVEISAGEGLAVRPPVVRVQSLHAAFVRVRAQREGTHEIAINVGGQRVTKELAVGRQGGAISPLRVSADAWDLLLSREPPLEAGPVSAVEVAYPLQAASWFGLPWWAILFIVSIIAAFALRGPFGVVI